MKSRKELMLFTLGVVLGNRIFLNLFIPGFTASLSVAVVGAFLYIFRNVKPLFVIPLTGIVAAVVRGVIEYRIYGSIYETIIRVAPDAGFLLVYALVYTALNAVPIQKNIQRFFVTIFLCDFVSNLTELIIRTGFAPISYTILQSLLVIALVRTGIAAVIVTIYRYQKTLIFKEEHEARYRDLLLQTASFETELYFMNKNIVEIEDVMKKSFRIYNHLNRHEYLDELKELALDIAKDVHEIKKGYLNRMKGMERFTDPRWKGVGMTLKTLIQVIKADTEALIEREGYRIEFSIKSDTDFLVADHYFFTTILKNLINNSIESIGHDKLGMVECVVKNAGGLITLKVGDTGEGIDPEDLPVVFKPGYSSRFDTETGDINRGLGLTLVKDLVEDHFMGTVAVESQLSKGTMFTISIPEKMLRGDL